MRTTSIFVLFTMLLTCFNSTGQSFFQEVSELGHTEQTELLEKYQVGRNGTEKMIIQRRFDFFDMTTPHPTLISKKTFSSLSSSEQLCVLWLDAFDYRHELEYSKALFICDSVLSNYNLSVYEEAEFKRFIGVTYHIWGDFPSALENLKKAEALFLKCDSEIGQVVTAYNICNTYMSAQHQVEFEKNLQSFQDKFGDIIHKYPYYEGNFNSLFMIKEYLHDNNELAFRYTIKNIELYKELNDSSNISRSSLNAAIYTQYSNHEDSTMFYLIQSKEFSAGEPHPRTQVEMLISLMEFLSKERIQKEVLALYGFKNMSDYFKKIDNILLEHKNEGLRLRYLRQHISFLKRSGKNELVSKLLYEENQIMHDIISRDTLNSKLINYKLELEKTKSSELDYQKTIANNERDRLAERVRQNKYWTIAFLIIAVLILIIIVRRYTSQKRAQNMQFLRNLEELKNQQLNEELKKTRLRLEEFRSQLIKKSKLIDEAKGNLNLTNEDQIEFYDKMRKMKILTDDDWLEFKRLFETVHPSMQTFLIENSISLTEGELRILMLFKLKYDRQHMGDMLGIGSESIRKAIYRLKKKIAPKELELVIMEF